jgi:hypothetical protein
MDQGIKRLIQMFCHQFLTIVENTRQARRRNPHLRYPYRDKRYHSLYWPARAVSVESGRVVLPMGPRTGLARAAS